MEENYRKIFGRALEYLLAQKGRGAMQRLSVDLEVDQSTISKIKLGKRTGKIETLQRIAHGLDTTYEEMLELGRRLQEDHQDLRTPLQAVRKPSADPDAGVVVLKDPRLNLDSDSPDVTPAALDVEATLQDLRAILEGGDQAAIEELQRCIARYRSADKLRRRLLEMDTRMRALEQRLAAADSRIRQNDDPAAKDRILKKREM